MRDEGRFENAVILVEQYPGEKIEMRSFEAPNRGQLTGAIKVGDSTALNLVESSSVRLPFGVVMGMRFIRPIPIERFAKKGFRQVSCRTVRTAYNFQFAKLALYVRVQSQQLSRL
jgi:hypothetical protein